MNEEEEAKAELEVSKHINQIDEELKDRFKALKVIQNQMHEFDEEEQKEVRKLEVIFEDKYKEIYELRRKFVNAGKDLDKVYGAKLVKEFNDRAADMKDEDYEKLEVTPCDVKPIQNSPNGVSNFWIKALLNHPIGGQITEKDRPILGYLLNI
jgi:hypothetical protein